MPLPTLEEQFLAEERERLQRERDRIRQARAAASIAQPANPQRTAEANKLAREVGQPAALVEQEFDRHQTEARAAAARRVTTSFPILGDWLADIRNAAIAQDDLPNLESVAEARKELKTGFFYNRLDALADGTYGGEVTPYEQSALFRRDQRARNASGFWDRMGAFFDQGAASVDSGLRRVGAVFQDDPGKARFLQTGARAVAPSEQITGATDWEAVKNNPTLGNIGSFIAEQGAASLPGMVAAVAAPGVFGLSQAGNIAQDRAENNNRTDATAGDVLRAAPAAAATVFLERFGAKGIFATPSRTVGGRIGRAAAQEGATEFLQGSIENIGGSLGTDAGFDIWQMLDEGFAGTVAGAGLGGALRSAVEVAQSTRRIKAIDKLMSRSAESQVRQRDPETFRALMAQLADGEGDGNIYVSGEVIASFNQDYANDEFWGRYSEEIDDSLMTGGDVAIPLADAAAHLSGTPDWDAIASDVRAAPGAMTANEVAAAEAEWETVRKEAGEALDTQEREARASAAPGERLRASIRNTLMSRGMDPDQAAADAEVSAALFETEAANLGYELTGREFEKAVSVQRVLPDMVADPQAADTLDVVVNAMRGAGDPEIGVGPTLMEFIRERGGINDPGGDLASMGVPSRMIREFNPDQGSLAGVSGAGDYGIDSTMRAAIEAGFFPDLTAVGNNELDTQRMLDAIGAELAGSPVYSETRLDTMRQAGEELRELLASAGLEPDTASMDEIRAAVERFDGGRGEPDLSVDAVLAAELAGGQRQVEAEKRAKPDEPAYSEGIVERIKELQAVDRTGIESITVSNPAEQLVARETDAATGYFSQEQAAAAVDVARVIARAAGAAEVSRAHMAEAFSYVNTARAANGARTLDQAAFHGSPHIFDRFSLDAIGTGEGAQAYGWGLYFAGRKEVADFYRNSLSGKPKFEWNVRLGNRSVADDIFAELQDEPYDKVRAEALHRIEGAVRSFGYASAPNVDGDFSFDRDQITRVVNTVSKYPISAEAKALLPSLIDEIQISGTRTTQGRLYEVEIPEDDEYLLWDKPLSEQPEKVQEALSRIGGVVAVTGGGAGFYIQLAEQMGEGRARIGGDKAASLALKEAGIAGIKYLDGSSRSDGDGSYNYVVFDDSRISIRAYEQNRGQGPQGQIQFTEGQALIRLFESANASTFQHEMAHFWLERMFANARRSLDTDGNPAARQTFADVEAIKAWFKDNGHPVEGDTIPTEAHEMFARAWEQYLMEGKAPTTRLQNAFRKFSRWLKRIYRTVANLNTPITPEIREVMDRMLATEQEIAQAAEARAAYLQFDNAMEAGMSEADARRYAELSEEVRSEAEEQLTGKVMRSIRAQGQKQWRAQEKVVRAEVEEMVDNRPPFAALKLLRQKDGPRLDKAWLQENFGEDVFGILPAGMPVWKQGGTNPDTMAELVGFSSGDQLVRELIGIETTRRDMKEGGDKRPVREAIIAQEVKAEMNRRFGDPLADGTIEREASAAVQNDRLGEKVELELKALGSKTKRKPTPYRMAREWARGRIAKGVIADMISGAAQHRYTRTAAKAARDAQSAILAGDMDAAFKHKQTEMLHNALAREAAEASQEVDVAVRRLGKFAKQTKAKTLPLDYLDRIHALLEGVEFKKVSQRGLNRREALRDWIASEEAEGRTVELPERVLNEIDNKNWSRLTVDELLLLREAVDQIAALGRLKTKLLTAQKDREVEAAATDMANAIEASKKGPKPVRTRETFAYRAASAFKGFKAMHRKMASLAREMDSVKDGGPVWDNLIRPMMERFDQEAEMNREATEKLLEILSPFYGRDNLGRPKMGGKGIYFESIGQSFNLEERMAIVGQMGNAGNLQRLIDGERGEFGFRWSMEQLNEIKDSLTQEQMEAVQAIWDLFESYRPLIAAKERRVSGVEPEWVEPTPVETQYGTFKGGYWPIKYDRARTLDAAQQADAAEAERQLRGAFTAATTHRSFTKSRAEKVVNRPLLYSMSGVTQGLTDVVHDLAFHEYLIDANRLLRHPKVSSAMLNYYGPEVMEQFRKGIEDVAAGDAPAQDAWERAINHVRMGATVAGLGWNLKTALLQPFGLTQSIVRVGAPWIARGASQFFAHPIETSREVSAKSRFMRERSNTMQREINEIRNRIRGGTKTGEFLNASFFYMITRTQLAVDIPTWRGAYEKAIAEGNEESRAVSLADQAVRDAQGGGQIGDLSAIQRGGPMRKLFTNFYSFFNTTYNLTAESWARTDFKKPGDVMALALDYLLLYSLPAAMGYALDKAFAGDDDDDDRSLAEGLASEHLSYLTGTMVGVRELDAPIQNLAEAATGAELNEYDFGYTGPAGLRFFAEGTRAAQQASQGEFDDAMRKSMFNTAGTLFHLPSGQINKTYEGGRALAEGETDNPLAIVSGN